MFVQQAIFDFSLTNLLVHTSRHISVFVSQAAADVTDRPATCPQACWAEQTLFNYATYVVNASLHIVRQGHGQQSLDVRAKLARSILRCWCNSHYCSMS